MNFEQSEIRAEAQRICDEKGLSAEDRPRVESALAHLAFMSAAQPLIDTKVRLLRFAMPRYLLHPDGRIEPVDDGLTDEMRKTAQQIDELIDLIMQRYAL